jgi:hypothetical protein
MNYYPEFYYPSYIDEIIDSIPKLPDKPIEPILSPKPEEPKIDYKDHFAMIKPSLYLFIFAGSLLVFNYSNEIGVKGNPLIIFLLFVFLFVFGAIIISSLIKINTIRKEFPDILNSYYTDLKKYPLLIEKHKTRVKSYELEMEEYNRIVNKIILESNLQNHRKSLLKNYLKKSKRPKEFTTTKTRKGVSESFFLNLLTKKFPNKIFTTFGLEDRNSIYFPDFTYWDNERSIYIDIEIDEPYIGHSGEPIHYLSEMKTSIDNKRNYAFIKNGWFILRFAEEQVFNSADICINFICDFIYLIENAKKITNLNVSFEKGKIVKKWNKSEANKMAFLRYRNSYLPLVLQSKINEEKLIDFEKIEINESKPSSNNYDEDDLPF